MNNLDFLPLTNPNDWWANPYGYDYPIHRIDKNINPTLGLERYEYMGYNKQPNYTFHQFRRKHNDLNVAMNEGIEIKWKNINLFYFDNK